MVTGATLRHARNGGQTAAKRPGSYGSAPAFAGAQWWRAAADGLFCGSAEPTAARRPARAFYDQPRAKGLEHNDALRRLAGRLVGILHGCLKTRTCYNETTANGLSPNHKPPIDIKTPGMS